MKPLVLVCVACVGVAQPLLLQTGTPAGGKLAPGEKQLYGISVTQNQYLVVSVVGGKLRLGVSLSSPDGQQAVVIPDTGPLVDPVLIPIISTAPGTYSLSVERLDQDASDSFRVSVAELRPVAPGDEQRIEAEAEFRAAQQGMAKDSRETRMTALVRYEHARALWEQVGDRAGLARTFDRIGFVYFRLGQSRQAIEAYERTLDLARQTGDRKLEANALNNLGLEHSNLGEHAKGLAYLEQAVPAYRAANPDRVSVPLSNIGFVYNRLGDIPKALEYSEWALRLRRETDDQPGEAATLATLASEYQRQGLYQQAIRYTQQALELWHALGDGQQEALALSNIGSLYLAAGDLELALDYLQRALPLRRAVANRPGEAATLANIAGVYLTLKQPHRAIDFYAQTVAIHGKLANRAAQASGLNGMGEAYAQLGRFPTALACHREARSFAAAAGERLEEGRALVGISNVYLRQGKPRQALPLAEQALTIFRNGGIRQTEQTALVPLAKAKADTGDLEGAHADLQTAIDLMESIRGSLAGSDSRATYSALGHAQYETLIDLLVRLDQRLPSTGYLAQALAVSERARARSLIELLGESRADIREGVEGALLEQEKAIRAELHVKARSSDKDVESLVLRYREIENQIREHSPRYAALTAPQPLGLSEIQTEVLDPDTLLIEFALGETRSYVFTVGTGSISVHELPPRATIESAARKAYVAMSSSGPANRGGEILALSRLLLGPITAKLDRKRLAIVAEGALQLIPFAALTDSAGQPLIASHEIISLPSASTLAVLRREIADRRPALKSILAFGDPVFDPGDSRVHSASSGIAKPPSPLLERSARDSGLERFERLPATRREVEFIASLARASSRKMLDFEASRQMATATGISDYRIVHFATHALLDNRHPDLSGLVLSLVDSKGVPVDGFLRASAVYNLKLGADLVVLSACQTALGEDVQGEGLVGLTRGFMYAGAPRVVASLWRVPDVATAELMRRFYRAMLVDHQTPAAAVRSAQATMRREARWRAPYYWAGFILEGEWR